MRSEFHDVATYAGLSSGHSSQKLCSAADSSPAGDFVVEFPCSRAIVARFVTLRRTDGNGLAINEIKLRAKGAHTLKSKRLTARRHRSRTFV